MPNCTNYSKLEDRCGDNDAFISVRGDDGGAERGGGGSGGDTTAEGVRAARRLRRHFVVAVERVQRLLWQGVQVMHD